MIEEFLIVRMGRRQRDAVVAMVMRDSGLLKDVFRCAISGTDVQRMKGSWVLSGIHAENPLLLSEYRSAMLRHLQIESVGGVKRELLRCFERVAMKQDEVEQLIMIVMNWVTDEHQDFAVRYLCFRLLKPMIKKYPELQMELSQRIELYTAKFGRFP